jgi:hypothetical protein
MPDEITSPTASGTRVPPGLLPGLIGAASPVRRSETGDGIRQVKVKSQMFGHGV